MIKLQIAHTPVSIHLPAVKGVHVGVSISYLVAPKCSNLVMRYQIEVQALSVSYIIFSYNVCLIWGSGLKSPSGMPILCKNTWTWIHHILLELHSIIKLFYQILELAIWLVSNILFCPIWKEKCPKFKEMRQFLASARCAWPHSHNLKCAVNFTSLIKVHAQPTDINSDKQ